MTPLTSHASSAAAGIVLCGGNSSRMGRSKALLPFGPELMLQRVVRILSGVVAPVVVVAAPNQELPALPDEILLARDERTGRGPLEGLLAGMKELARRGYGADLAIFVTSCDVPLLREEFVRQVLAELGSQRAAVPVEGQFAHPLAAAYRLAVLPEIEAFLAADQLRPTDLVDHLSARRIPVDALRRSDPNLLSLLNCNRLSDYQAALKSAGFSAEKVD